MLSMTLPSVTLQTMQRLYHFPRSVQKDFTSKTEGSTIKRNTLVRDLRSRVHFDGA